MRNLARFTGYRFFSNMAYTVGRSAAAAANNVDHAVANKILYKMRGFMRHFVITAEFVWQARVRISRNEHIRFFSKFFQVRTHFFGAQSTIQPDRKQVAMAYRVPECLNSLARKRTAGGIRNGARYHDTAAFPESRVILTRGFAFVLVSFDGKKRRFGIQRIKYGFDQ